MVAVSLLSIMAVAMSQFFGSSNKIQRRAKARASMQFIASDIENKLKSPSSLYLSLLDATNANYIQCVLGSGVGCTSALTHPPTDGNYNFFALDYASGLQSVGVMTNVDPVTPIYYDVSGLQCKKPGPTNPNCAFQAQTFFYATCENNASTCAFGPAEIHVAYRVIQVPHSLPDLAPLPSLPQSSHFFTHQVKNILGPYVNSSCNPGAVIRGYNANGSPNCVCSSPYTQAYIMPANVVPLKNIRGPICRKITQSELTCPENTVFRGLTPTGLANCLPASSAYICIPASPYGSLSARCPPGYWVQQDQRSGCQFHCTMPKQDATWTACNSNEAKDDRLPGGYLATSSPHYNQVEQVVKANGGQSSSGILMGLVCSTRTLTCCRPL